MDITKKSLFVLTATALFTGLLYTSDAQAGEDAGNPEHAKVPQHFKVDDANGTTYTEVKHYIKKKGGLPVPF